jgi:hypothetical protein
MCNVRARAVRATTRSVRARVVRQHAWCEGEGVEVLFEGREMQSSPAIFFLCIHIRAAVYRCPVDAQRATMPCVSESLHSFNFPCIRVGNGHTFALLRLHPAVPFSGVCGGVMDVQSVVKCGTPPG